MNYTLRHLQKDTKRSKKLVGQSHVCISHYNIPFLSNFRAKGLWLDKLLTVETRATCQSSRCHSQRISGETTANNMISIASTIYTHSTSATKCVNSKNTVCWLLNYRDAVFLHWHYPWWQKAIYGRVQSRCSPQPPPRCSILVLFGLQKSKINWDDWMLLDSSQVE